MRHGEDNRGKCINNPAARHPIWTIDAPTSIFPPILRQMPFLSQLPIYPNNNNNIPLIKSSHNARQHRLGLCLSRTTAVHKLDQGCHVGQPMVLDQRWAAAGSGPGQPT